LSVILQISDPHFGSEQAPVVDALVGLTRRQQPDLLVLSGDITQRARPAQFRAAQVFIGCLGTPALVIPGNHDIPLFDLWARLHHPYANFIAAFGAELEPAHSSHDLLRVVVVHQPVAVTHAEDVPNLLRGHAEALHRWSAAGADIVMGGHIHLPYVKAIQGLGRPVWAVQAGTAVSSRVRARGADSLPHFVNGFANPHDRTGASGPLRD
jgi:predicted phosphodiesterase